MLSRWWLPGEGASWSLDGNELVGLSGPGSGCHDGNVAPAMRGSGFLRNPMRGRVVCVAWQGGWGNPSSARARLRVSPKPKSHLGLFEQCTSASSPSGDRSFPIVAQGELGVQDCASRARSSWLWLQAPGGAFPVSGVRRRRCPAGLFWRRSRALGGPQLRSPGAGLLRGCGVSPLRWLGSRRRTGRRLSGTPSHWARPEKPLARVCVRARAQFKI